MPYIGNKTADTTLVEDNSISSAKIVDSAVTTAKVNNDAVTVDKLNLISTGSVPSLEAKGDGSSQDGYIQLNCSQNSHGVKLKSPPHSASQSYTLTLPSTAPATDKMLQTNSSGVLSFVDAPSGAMELLSSATRTSGSVSQVYMTDFMDNTKYISYIAHCSFKNAGNGNNQFFNFTSSGGTTMEATNYYGAGNQVKNANGTLSNNTREIATNENSVSWVATASTRLAFMEFVMHPIGVTTDSGVSTVFFRGQTDRWSGSREPQYVTGAAYYINSTVPTGFVIGASGGNWERYEIRVYGLKKA